MARPAGLEPATSGLEKLTRSAMNRHHLCRFVSSLVTMGTGQEWTGVDGSGQVGSSWTPFGWSGSKSEAGPVAAWPDRTLHREATCDYTIGVPQHRA